MKKLKKFLVASALACAAIALALSFSACYSVTSYYGEYKYENEWVAGQYYGVKVKVDVQSDKKGERIRSVTVLESVYVEATESWSGKTVWDEGLDALLKSYRGKYIGQILFLEVPCEESGAPLSTTEGGLSADSDYLITGATVGSGRLLLAVQNALLDAAESMGYRYYDGEYYYENAWVSGAYYGIKVRVAVKGGAIKGVGVLPSDYTEASASWDGRQNWDNGLQDLLDSYIGKSVSSVLAVQVGCSESGEPLSSAEGGLSSDSGYIITGATVGTERLLLAVQNALASLG